MAELANVLADFASAARRHAEATQQGDYRAANQSVDRLERTWKSIARYGDVGKQALLSLTRDQVRRK